ncbi:MAG: hypothetical protein SNJ59_00945 [Aggregatilineales bacterium]
MSDHGERLFGISALQSMLDSSAQRVQIVDIYANLVFNLSQFPAA